MSNNRVVESNRSAGAGGEGTRIVTRNGIEIDGGSQRRGPLDRLLSRPVEREHVIRVIRVWSVLVIGVMLSSASASGATEAPVDATTLRHKVMAGYQGWFRCPGDPANEGWKHWSRSRQRIAPDTLTFDMWPDLKEFGGQIGVTTNLDTLFSLSNPYVIVGLLLGALLPYLFGALIDWTGGSG